MSKYSVWGDLLVFCSIWGIRDANPWFYAFFEKEIHSLNKPIKEAYLMKSLDKEEYSRRIFAKPKKQNLDLCDEYFGNGNTPGNEYNKLKDENENFKFEIAELEETITDLNHKIRQLESELTAKRKVKEWDGKYYRCCKVTMDEFPNGLSDEVYELWLKDSDERSCFESEISPAVTDKVLTLSTCSYEFDNASVLLGILQ